MVLVPQRASAWPVLVWGDCSRVAGDLPGELEWLATGGRAAAGSLRTRQFVTGAGFGITGQIV